MNVVAREFHPEAGLTAQVEHYAEIRNRIARGDPKPPTTILSKAAADAALIGELREENAALKRDLTRAQNSLRFVADRESHHRQTEAKLQRLELDLADAQARILSQAEMLLAINDVGDEPTDNRRPVPAIVAEVLADYPGTTWADVKSLRRTRELVAPRQACMVAVYDERKDLSLPQIGRLFNRDHTTVLHAVRKVKAQRGEA